MLLPVSSAICLIKSGSALNSSKLLTDNLFPFISKYKQYAEDDTVRNEQHISYMCVRRDTNTNKWVKENVVCQQNITQQYVVVVVCL